MNLSKHCELCENRIFDIQTGTACGLTNNKPQFHQKCPDIKFGEKHIDLIKEINLDYHKVISIKGSTITRFTLLGSAGVFIMMSSYVLHTITWEAGGISTVPIIVAGIGLMTLSTASRTWIRFNQQLRVEQTKKTQLDSLLSSYGIRYDVDISSEEDVHGNKEYDISLVFV
jgi:hypothetical protein